MARTVPAISRGVDGGAGHSGWGLQHHCPYQSPRSIPAPASVAATSTVGEYADVASSVAQYADSSDNSSIRRPRNPPQHYPAGSLYEGTNVSRHVSVSGCIDTD